MSDRVNDDDVLEQMKKHLESERLRRGYSIDEPLKPVRNKNTFGRMVLSVFIVTLIVVIVATAISVIALQNSGYPFDFFFPDLVQHLIFT